MSKLETPLTRRYWKSVGGTLIEEFAAVGRATDHGTRLIDGVIIKNGPRRIAKKSEVDLEGKEIIVVQTKAERLGMYLMGQAIFSRDLMKRFKPKHVHSVAICTKGDSVLEPLLKRYKDVELVVYKS